MAVKTDPSMMEMQNIPLETTPLHQEVEAGLSMKQRMVVIIANGGTPLVGAVIGVTGFLIYYNDPNRPPLGCENTMTGAGLPAIGGLMALAGSCLNVRYIDSSCENETPVNKAVKREYRWIASGALIFSVVVAFGNIILSYVASGTSIDGCGGDIDTIVPAPSPEPTGLSLLSYLWG